MSNRSLDTLAQRVRTARKARGLSQEELAEQSGLKQADISKLETGRILKTTGVARLARALRVPDLWLELNEGPAPEWNEGAQAGGGSQRERPHAQTETSSNKKRLQVSEWVKAGPGGTLESMQVEEEALGFVELFESPMNLIAIRVRGDGLRPAIEDGRVLVIAPGVAAEPEEWVLITARDGARQVKKLLNRKSDSITVSDLRTDAQSTILFAEIDSLDPIAAVYSARQWQRGPVEDAVRGTSIFGELDDDAARRRKVQ